MKGDPREAPLFRLRSPAEHVWNSVRCDVELKRNFAVRLPSDV